MNLPGVARLADAARAARAGDAPRGADQASAPFVLPQPGASTTQGADARATQAAAREARNERGSTRAAREPAQDRVAQRHDAAPGAGRPASEDPQRPASQSRIAEAHGERDERREAAVDDMREPEAVGAADTGPSADVANGRAEDAPMEAAEAAARGEALPGAAPGAPSPDAGLPARMLALLGATPEAQRDVGASLASAMPDASPGAPSADTELPVLTLALPGVMSRVPRDAGSALASSMPGASPASVRGASAGPALHSPTSGLPGVSGPLPAPSSTGSGMPAGSLPGPAVVPDGGNPFAALAALVARAAPGDEATRSDRADLPPLVDPSATPTDAPASLPGAARATSDVAATRLQFAAPVVLPARPELGMDEAFDQRILWMAEQRIGQAEMRVSPEGAGPIDVRLQIDGHRVSAQFSAANADVRQALEAGLERLRDLLGQRGMELADAQVGQQHARPGQGGAPTARGAADVADDADSPVTTVRALRARGLVDEYV